MPPDERVWDARRERADVGTDACEAARRYPHWTGLLLMINDENNGPVTSNPDGGETITTDFQTSELERLKKKFEFCRQVLVASGARQTLWTGMVCTHAQGGCRMGSDPSRSAVDTHAESHDVKRRFVGDGSTVPRTLSVNPSLTIMALATRLAEYIDADRSEYFHLVATQSF